LGDSDVPYKRTLDIEGNRLVAKNSQFERLVTDHYCTGTLCHCCEGFWRFLPNPFLRSKLDVRNLKYKWFTKSRRKLWKNLYDAEADKYVATGREDLHWWKTIVDRYSM